MNASATIASKVMTAAWAEYKSTARNSHLSQDHGKAAFGRILKKTWANFNKVEKASFKLICTRTIQIDGQSVTQTIVIAKNAGDSAWMVCRGYDVVRVDVKIKGDTVKIYASGNGKEWEPYSPVGDVKAAIAMIEQAKVDPEIETAKVVALRTGRPQVIRQHGSFIREGDVINALLVATPDGQIKVVYDNQY